MALIVNQLWQRGLFTDGGSFVPDQNKRERDRPRLIRSQSERWV